MALLYLLMKAADQPNEFRLVYRILLPEFPPYELNVDDFAHQQA